MAPVDGANQGVGPNNEDNPQKKTRTCDPVYKVLKSGNTRFGKQVVQNTSTKRECIKVFIPKVYDDETRFWLDFAEQAKRLLDSAKFNEYCTVRGLTARYVAEHVVAEGKKKVGEVLEKGLAYAIGEDIVMFHESLFDTNHELYTRIYGGGETKSEGSTPAKQ